VFIHDLAVDSQNSAVAYAAVLNEKVAKSTDGGASWSDLQNAGENRGVVAVDPRSPGRVLSGIGMGQRTNMAYDIEISDDGGRSWRNTNFFLITFGTFELGVSDIVVHPLDSNTILVAMAGYGSTTGGGGIYKTENLGLSWQCTREQWANKIAVDPNAPGVMYFCSSSPGYVFRSENSGNSWTNISYAGTDFWVDDVYDLAVDEQSNLYAATGDGLWKKPAGSGWIKLNGLPAETATSLAMDFTGHGAVLYVGLVGHGVCSSADAGSTWVDCSQGLGNLNIVELELSACKPLRLYAGTAFGGVWVRGLRQAPPGIWLLLEP
jgi:hypothetical protein